MPLKFKKLEEPIALTEDFWYMLYRGGYIKPSQVLEDP